jgi:choline dehydrogenase-like flavoprotein
MATSRFAQETDFSRDALGRYVCNGLDEALEGARQDKRPDARPWDIIVVGGGTFGAAMAQHLFHKDLIHRHRILVLEGGPFLVPEHVQNLPMIGLGVADPTSVRDLKNSDVDTQRRWRKEAWGLAWHSPIRFPGLAYVVGGRSLYWGGWSPRLLDQEMPGDRWPRVVVDDLGSEYFDEASDQLGVTETNDFLYGDLQTALRRMLYDGISDGKVLDAIPLRDLPDHPLLARDRQMTAKSLAGILGMRASFGPLSPGAVAENDLKNLLKLEAPLAVEGRTPRSGYFANNKFSTMPLLVRAARMAFEESGGDDVKKRLMVVPNCHVTRLVTGPAAGPSGTTVLKVVRIETNLGDIAVAEGGKVIIALGTIESARLALVSFHGAPGYGRIGKGLMAHLRSNLTIRIPREVLPDAANLKKELQAAALFVKGRHGLTDQSIGYFHLQITASGLGPQGANAETELFKKVPDIDTLDRFKTANDSHVVITIRAIGEMEPENPSSEVRLDQNGDTDFGVVRAFVTIQPSGRDTELWRAIDRASDQTAKVFASAHDFEVLTPGGWVKANEAADLEQVLPYDQTGRRDGLGTTHHEAGTLPMGDDPARSVTNAMGRLHDVENAYALGPALFPTIGSPNPMLTGIALTRRLADHLLQPEDTFVAEKGFRLLFDGTDTRKWRMSTIRNQSGRDDPGRFIVVDGGLESVPGTDLGLFWCTEPLPPDFVLKLEWRRWRQDGVHEYDNSGVFLRFPDPESKGYDNTAYVGVDYGLEVQIDELGHGPFGAVGQGPSRTSAIYGLAAPGRVVSANPPGEWNEFEIHARDQNYKVYLNGQPVTEYTFPGDPKHAGRAEPSSEGSPRYMGLQTYPNGSRVAFRRIRVKDLGRVEAITDRPVRPSPRETVPSGRP